jgi:hypothetical protein
MKAAAFWASILFIILIMVAIEGNFKQRELERIERERQQTDTIPAHK